MHLVHRLIICIALIDSLLAKLPSLTNSYIESRKHSPTHYEVVSIFLFNNLITDRLWVGKNLFIDNAKIFNQFSFLTSFFLISRSFPVKLRRARASIWRELETFRQLDKNMVKVYKYYNMDYISMKNAE